jgi:hypothetical protein
MKIYLMNGSQVAHEGEIVQTDRITKKHFVKTDDGLYVAWNLQYRIIDGIIRYAIADNWFRGE